MVVFFVALREEKKRSGNYKSRKEKKFYED